MPFKDGTCLPLLFFGPENKVTSRRTFPAIEPPLFPFRPWTIGFLSKDVMLDTIAGLSYALDVLIVVDTWGTVYVSAPPAKGILRQPHNILHNASFCLQIEVGMDIGPRNLPLKSQIISPILRACRPFATWSCLLLITPT